jgi:hypothetical protein
LRSEMQPTPRTSRQRKSRGGTDNHEQPPTSLRTTYNRARKSKNSFYDNSIYDLSPLANVEVEEEVFEDEEDVVEEHREPRKKRRRRQADPPPSLTFQKEDDDDDDNDNVWRNDNLNHIPGLPSLNCPADTTDTSNNSAHPGGAHEGTEESRSRKPNKFNNDQRSFLQKLFVNYRAEVSGIVNHDFIKQSLLQHTLLFPQPFIDELSTADLGRICAKLKAKPTAKVLVMREQPGPKKWQDYTDEEKERHRAGKRQRYSKKPTPKKWQDYTEEQKEKQRAGKRRRYLIKKAEGAPPAATR